MQVRAWGPVFALLGMIIAALIASALDKTKISYHPQPTHSENQNCVASVSGLQHGCDKGSSEKKGHWYDTFGDRPTDWLLVLFNFLLVIVTAALVISTNKLWDAGERQLSHSQKASQQQLRAYVLVQTGAVRLNFNAQGSSFSVRVEIKNFGQTPAYSHSTWIGGGIYPFDDLPFPGPTPLEARKAKSILGPGDTVSIDCAPTFISLDDLQKVRSEKRGIFIWGGANYTDIFGEPRRTIFRIRVAGFDVPLGTNSQGLEIRGWPLKPHPLGYDAD